MTGSTVSILEVPEGSVLEVRVVPGGSDRILGEHDSALKIGVHAPPEKGKANKALLAFLARSLGVKKSSVRVVRGEHDRRKRILFAGVDPDRLREAVNRWMMA